MNIKEKIKSLLKEAELYKSQRLLEEARERYTLVIETLRQQTEIPNLENLINGVEKKRAELDQAIAKWDKAQITPEVSDRVQDLIKRLFTSASNERSPDEHAVDEAITLAKFGQHRKALAEFNRLVHVPEVGLKATKNAVKCHLELAEVDEALEMVVAWNRGGCYTPEQYTSIISFMRTSFEKEGIAWDDSRVYPEETQVSEETSSDFMDDDIIDITSIGISIDEGPMSGNHVELDVSFQSGSLLSLIVSGSNEALINLFQRGQTIHDVDFYSPIAIFKGSAVVESNTRINSGPKKGDFSLDIRIDSI